MNETKNDKHSQSFHTEKFHGLIPHEEEENHQHTHDLKSEARNLSLTYEEPKLFARDYKVVTIRSHSGLSGDILFSGLAVLLLKESGIEPGSEEARLWISELCTGIMPQLADCAQLNLVERAGINGWSLNLNLAISHEHRNLTDIRKIAEASRLSPEAKNLGLEAFELLAKCEAEVHNRSIEEVHFHEVGALDSILDIFGVCELYCRLGFPLLSASPLPVADGSVNCAHGVLPVPAPAALKLLEGFPVRPFEGALDSGELLTPTALALLHALHVSFGTWPAFIVEETALIYGKKSFPNAPNGTVFVLGQALR